MAIDEVAEEVLGTEISENYKFIAMVLGVGVVAGIVGLFLLPSFIAVIVSVLVILVAIFVIKKFTYKMIAMIIGLVLLGTGVMSWILFNALHGFATPEQLSEYGGIWSLLSIPFSVQTKFNELIYSLPAGSTLIGAGKFRKVGFSSETTPTETTPTIAPTETSYSWADIA